MLVFSIPIAMMRGWGSIEVRTTHPETGQHVLRLCQCPGMHATGGCVVGVVEMD